MPPERLVRFCLTAWAMSAWARPLAAAPLIWQPEHGVQPDAQWRVLDLRVWLMGAFPWLPFSPERGAPPLPPLSRVLPSLPPPWPLASSPRASWDLLALPGSCSHESPRNGGYTRSDLGVFNIGANLGAADCSYVALRYHPLITAKGNHQFQTSAIFCKEAQVRHCSRP